MPRRSAPNVTGAEDVRWDLTHLHPDADAVREALRAVGTDSEAFSSEYRGRVASLEAPDLARALEALGAIQDRAGRAYAYAYLDWSTDTADSARGALLQHVREAYTAVARRILFFELEWAMVDDDRAAVLLRDPSIAPYRHFLDVQRLQRDHLLTEPEESLLVEKSLTGAQAWTRFFDETVGAVRFRVDGQELTQQQVLARLHEPDRETRRAAALAFADGLGPELRTLTFVFNTLVADKHSDDRLRRFGHWLAARNLSNEVADEVVDQLIGTVEGGYGLVGRFYRLKRRLLGLDELFDYDRYAPVGEASTRYDWPDARRVVESSYAAFHPELGRIVARFFEERWIDAGLSPGKRSGAFSHGTVPSAHPYVLLNYTGRTRDVQTLAHELGHGVHQYLSRAQGIFHADTPLTTAETASVFGEMLVFHRLLAAEPSPRNRLAMIVAKLDDTVATVFRQVAMNRFEDRVHRARRERGELTSDDFSGHWMDTQRAMFDGAVTLGDHYASWWSYIPHFLHTPGYVYAYAFGELLVLALYRKYQEEGSGFADRYVDLLAAGGSDWPHVLVGALGIDLTDPGFWGRGLEAIGELVATAEALADEVRV
jgi:oligoendopeptidase F